MKKIRKIVAAALVTFQVILTAAVGFIPASAEAGTGANGRGRSYHAYKADAPITLDGKVTEGEAWDNLPWSEDLVMYEGSLNLDFDVCDILTTSGAEGQKGGSNGDFYGNDCFGEKQA